MRLRRLLSVLAVGLVAASPAGAVDLASYGSQTQRLVGSFLPFAAPASSNALAAIWADKMPAVQQELAVSNAILNANLAKGSSPIPMPVGPIVESATLTLGPTTIILSVLQSPIPGECQSGAALSISDDAMICPMRVAVIANGMLQTVYSAPSFCYIQKFVDDPTTISFDNSSLLAFTKVTFDPTTYLLTPQTTDNGGDGEVCNEAPIKLSF